MGGRLPSLPNVALGRDVKRQVRPNAASHKSVAAQILQSVLFILGMDAGDPGGRAIPLSRLQPTPAFRH
jgi:hypothetical protein